MQQKQLNKGAFSVVSRPSNISQGQRTFVVKRPLPSLPQTKIKQIEKTYTRQKKILDFIHKKNPSKSYLFNEIYQITPTHQVKMKDLGDMDLSTLRLEHVDFLSENLDKIIPQIVDALITMWKTGIVHLDIKMENIMIQYNPSTRHFQISLIDFTDSMIRSEIALRSSFKFAGTPCFMSPELLRRMYKRPRDTSPGTWKEYVANDLWAFGMVLYFLIYDKHLCNMFHKMFFGQKIPTPLNLYQKLKKWPDVYNTLFPTDHLAHKKKRYIPIIKTLLSLDPDDRIQWLNDQVQKQQRPKPMSQQQQKQWSASKKKKRTV